MATPGPQVAAPIQRARAKFAGAPEEQEDYTPPGPTTAPPIPTREKRQQRGPKPPTSDEILATAAHVQKAERAKVNSRREIPHWELTLADLRQQRDALDTAIAALEALYK